jgi:ribosome modulation factor
MKVERHIVQLPNWLAMTIAAIVLLLGSSGPAAGQTICECYQAGLSGQSRPDSCVPHTMGPMTPWMGGYYDRRNSNSAYRNDNGWCEPAASDSETSSPAESRTEYGAFAPPRYTTQSINTREACSCGNDTALNVLFVRAGAERCTAGARYICEVGFSGSAGWSPRGDACSAQDYCMARVEGPSGITNRPLSGFPTESSSSSSGDGPNSCQCA